MKTKKNIFKLSILAGVLACILIAGSLFASGAAAGAETEGLNILVSVPSASVAAGEKFEAVVKLANEDITEYCVAGLQVELAYDAQLLTAGTITHTLDKTESTAVSNATDKAVKFVCVKNDFSEEAGYTTLTNLFKVEFTAKSAIANPAALFSKDSISYMFGDTTAMEITKADSVYGADIEAIAIAILNTDLELVVTESLGTIIVAPTPAGDTALTKAELEETLGADATLSEGAVIGTGSTITADEKTATIVVVGDVDGDGIVTVFDAAMVKKANAENADAADKFAENDIKEYAADFDSNKVTNDTDVKGLLQHTIG